MRQPPRYNAEKGCFEAELVSMRALTEHLEAFGIQVHQPEVILKNTPDSVVTLILHKRLTQEQGDSVLFRFKRR
jgi:hypothetical protein